MCRRNRFSSSEISCAVSIISRTAGVLGQTTVGDCEVPLPRLERELGFRSSTHLRPRTLERSHALVELEDLAAELKLELLGGRFHLLFPEQKAGEP